MPKILFLTGYNLNRPDCGATVRGLNILRLLAQVGEVRVVLASDGEDHLRDAGPQIGGFELCHVVHFKPTGTRSLAERFRYEFDGRFINTYDNRAASRDVERLNSLLASHDMVWIHGLRIANGFGLWQWPRSVLDIDDIQSCVHHTAMEGARTFVHRLRQYRQVTMWRRRERFLMERFDAVCVCSAPDRDELGSRLGISDRVQVLPNGFAFPKESPQRRLSFPLRIGFIGNFYHAPNRQGLRWFIGHVWPLILRAMPDVRLRVVGDGSETENWNILENVDVLGFVADTESEMATWGLTIVPIFYGGGTRVKTAEAFSRKCPVVSTRLGVYGYDVVDGNEALIADSAEQFALNCLRVLGTPSLAEAMAENAWQRFLKHWTWDSYADRVAGVVSAVLEGKKAPSNQEVISVQGTRGHD